MTDNDTTENPLLVETLVETERESDRFVAQNAEKPRITVVIPTLNEAEHIGMCLDSVFRAFSDGPAFEVVLVDSNSDDETIEIAAQYPITILQITRDELTTPGAGRYVGTQVARGEQILFVDADMDIMNDGVLEASRLLNERADIAGIDGCLNEATVETPENVDALRGVALYDTKRLNEVGGFDPFLQGYEDIDLGFRMREAGYDLLRLPTVFATHSRPYGPSELKRRWQSGYYFGFGQAIRKFSTSP